MRLFGTVLVVSYIFGLLIVVDHVKPTPPIVPAPALTLSQIEAILHALYEAMPYCTADDEPEARCKDREA